LGAISHFCNFFNKFYFSLDNTKFKSLTPQLPFYEQTDLGATSGTLGGEYEDGRLLRRCAEQASRKRPTFQ
jgi:hypothetical protein